MDERKWLRKQPAAERRKVLASAKSIKAFVAGAILHKLQGGETYQLEKLGQLLHFVHQLEEELTHSFKPAEECC